MQPEATNHPENELTMTRYANAYPSFWQALMLLVYVILISIALLIPVLALPEGNIFTETGEAVTYVGSLMLVIFIGNRYRKSGHFSLRSIPVALYFIILFVVPAWIIVIEPVINLIPVTEWGKKFFEGLMPHNFTRIALIVVAAPILEELLFRGVILNGFLKRYSPVNAILLSSFLFGLIHLNPWQFIVAFCLGLMLGWLFWKTRSLIPCIFLHYVNNAFVTILNLAGDPETTTTEAFGDIYSYSVIFFVSCLVLVLAFVLAGRLLKPLNQ